MNDNIKSDFPHDGKIYLNNASSSLNSLQCIQAMTDFLTSYSIIGPDSIESEPFVSQRLYKTRKAISEILKCKPEEIVLTQSTTDGINLVANGMNFKPNSNIIIRGLTHEHHSNYYPWLRLEKTLKIKSLDIDKDGFFKFDDLRNFIDDNTKLVALSHALYNSGAILPLNQVGEILNDKNIPFFVDAAQSVGCIGEIDVNKIKCDFMSFNGSKWLCGPMGTGLFYCKKSSSDLLQPTSIGGESAMIYDEKNLAFKDMPDKFQTGFRNYVGMVGLEAAVNHLTRFGMVNIRKKIIKLADQLRDDLIKIPGVTLYGPKDSEHRTSIVSFNLKGYDPNEVVKKLQEKKIILAVREIFDQKIIRASPHFFNSSQEIQTVIDEIKKL